MPLIKLRDDESLENALRRFKRKCEKSGILTEIKKRQHYEKPSVRKSLSLTMHSTEMRRRGVFHGFSGLKADRRLKVVLLSGTMGVLGSLAACTGISSSPPGPDIGKTELAGLVSTQTVDECLPWDIACLLLRPVGAVPGGTPGGASPPPVISSATSACGAECVRAPIEMR